VRRLLALALLLPLSLSAADDPTYKALRAARPDGRTIAVEGFAYDSDVYHFTLTGTLHLLAPVDGQNVAAVFLGNGRYELRPAVPAEQRQLALWANDEKLTVLSDDFDHAVFFSSDLLKAAEGKGGAPKSGSPDSQAGGVFDTYMKKQRRDFSTNVQLRVAQDLLNKPAENAFLAYVDGKKYPPAMLVVDPLGALSGGGGEETMMYVSHDTKGGVWYSSHLRKEAEKGVAQIAPPLADAEHYLIETTIKPNAEIEGTTTMTIVPSAALRVLPINLAPKARMSDVSSAPAGPTPAWTGAAFIQEDEKEDADAAIVFPAAVKAGEKLLVKVAYKGKEILVDAGDHNYTVGSRSGWYPNVGTFDDLATYELRFRFPQKNQIVAVGNEAENRVEGDDRIAVWKAEKPLRVAGFNYGRFKKLSSADKDSGMTVDVYTNPGTPAIIDEINRLMQGPIGSGASLGPSIRVDTTRLAQSAMADGVNTARTGNVYFGPLAETRVSITQQSQWFFGQSWPSLIYLPYTAFLDSTTRMNLGLMGMKSFVDAVGPHEFAHQWWGHQVGWRSYRDQWLSEGFAEFTAGLVLQQSGGWKTYNDFFEKARRHILEKPRYGTITNDQAGPISQGWRLSTWQNQEAGEAMMYSKGAYVLDRKSVVRERV